ncbi:unnamed protein product [Cladocopium goreaui]|uniref:Coenzyme Q-binding protein COQ10 START domain-containing protein n=1 Tax=Cladocopium goreaui TaxID=2562237 RepID=A0A9P1DLA0_9DINO|nr:unnamed protein product [Cladocopium goreaui]
MSRLGRSWRRLLTLGLFGLCLDLEKPFSQPPVAVRDAEPTARRSNDEWFSFGNSVIIVGATAGEAYEVYANLQNHPEWSTMLSRVEVHNNARSSTWSLQALGFSLSWTADITRQVPSRLISWESTSGLKNAGVASFSPLMVKGSPSCSVAVQMSIRAPGFLRRLFQSRRLSALAASAIKKDLEGFRQVVLARATTSALVGDVAVKLAPLTNHTYKDGLGSCQVLVEGNGTIEIQVRGFGTSDSTKKLLEDCANAMGKLDDRQRCTAVVDLTKGVGCSPLAVPTIISFLQHNGGRITRTAVLGPRPLMALAQMISKLARQSGVAFFVDRAEADRWCAETDDEADQV